MEAGFWRKLVPGEYYEAHYSDDDVAHERLPLWPVGRGLWVVHSADGDSWIEDVSGKDGETGPSHTYGFGTRGGRAVTRPPLYRFRERPDRDTLKNLIMEAIELAQAEDPEAAADVNIPKHVIVDGTERVTIARFLPEFVEFARAHAGAGDDSPKAKAKAKGKAKAKPTMHSTRVNPKAKDESSEEESAADDDDVWLLCEPTEDGNIGDEVEVDPAVDAVAGARGLKSVGDGWVLVEKVAADDVAGFVASIHKRARGVLEVGRGEPEGRKPRKGKRGAGGGVVDEAAGHGDDDEADPVAADVRTLWVNWDEHGERWKDFRDAVRESTEEPFADSPLEGTRTALHMARMMDRTGGCPRRWLEQWLREKHIETGDRVAHEMRVLTEVLRTAACYDQLNVGSVIGIEILCRRIATVVEAYSDPNKLNWANAKFYAGVPSSEEVIHPALRTQVSKKAKEEAELATARVRTAGLRAQPYGAEDLGGGEPESPAGGKGGGRNGRRGRGGKGPGVPAGG